MGHVKTVMAKDEIDMLQKLHSEFQKALSSAAEINQSKQQKDEDQDETG